MCAYWWISHYRNIKNILVINNTVDLEQLWHKSYATAVRDLFSTVYIFVIWFYSPSYRFTFSLWHIMGANPHSVCVDRRKKKWRNKDCCTSSLDCIIVALQKWSCKWSVPAKVVFILIFGQLCLPALCSWFPVSCRWNGPNGVYNPQAGYFYP